MNFSKYLESRFVTSQIQIQKKQTTGGHAENHAILAWMYITLKIITAFQMILLAFHYVGVALHLISTPREAREIVRDEAIARQQAQEAAKQMAEQLSSPNGGMSVVQNT